MTFTLWFLGIYLLIGVVLVQRAFSKDEMTAFPAAGVLLCVLVWPALCVAALFDCFRGDDDIDGGAV